MNYSVGAGDHPVDCRRVRQLGAVHLLSGMRCAERHTIGKPQNRVDAPQGLTQRPADSTTGTGNQHSMHILPPGLADPSPRTPSCHSEWRPFNLPLKLFILCQAGCLKMTLRVPVLSVQARTKPGT